MQSFEEVKKAFSLQSEIFDAYEEQNEILKWMRSITHRHVMRHLEPGNEILEINSGTGLDAIYFAEMGFKILCTDISEGMLNKLNEKVRGKNLSDRISFRLLSFTMLDELDSNSFDYIFSNFGGLNCAESLENIFIHFKRILRQGGKATLVIIPPVCPWELALMFKGKFRTAFRRLHKSGVTANIEGIKFKTYYYSVKRTLRALGNDFKVLELQGLASVSPPPYMINFPKRFPHLYKILIYIDEKFSHAFPFNRFADHFILTVQYLPDIQK